MYADSELDVIEHSSQNVEMIQDFQHGSENYILLFLCYFQYHFQNYQIIVGISSRIVLDKDSNRKLSSSHILRVGWEPG